MQGGLFFGFFLLVFISASTNLCIPDSEKSWCHPCTLINWIVPRLMCVAQQAAFRRSIFFNCAKVSLYFLSMLTAILTSNQVHIYIVIVGACYFRVCRQTYSKLFSTISGQTTDPRYFVQRFVPNK